MRESLFETIVGALVVIVAGFFLAFALTSTSSGSGSTGAYEVIARFNAVTGVDRGTDVRIAGVKVGRVLDVEFDPARAEAVLTLSLRDDIELPDDSDARISSDGLLGGSFVSIEYGGGFDVIPTDGTGEIIYTRGSVDLLTLFASFASGQGSGEE